MEIGALIGDDWTGIPCVVAGLAEAALRDPAIDWAFMIDTMPAPRRLVEHMLARRSGAAALASLSARAWAGGGMPRAAAARAAGVFTNVKPARGLFAREAIVVYDLSPLLTPQFHDEARIGYFADHIRGDIDTSERIFCISEATRGDVAAYFGVPAERLARIVPGVRFDPADLSLARLPAPAESYVAIVGTLEPRKNGRIMLDHLVRDPAFAARHRIVFIGRDGWLDEKARLLDAVEAAGIAANRILFAGFLSEREKTALMLNAAFCVYPSVFEGYGLPVLEAAVLGRLTVCSNTTALPEVAPEASILFDPLDPDSFADALARAEGRAALDAPSPSLAILRDRAAAADAVRAYPPIAQWVTAG